MWESRVLRRAFERLELHERKLSRAVLRGGGGGDVTSLPDTWVGNHPGLPGPCPVSEILGRAGAVTNTETDDMEIAGKAITIPKGTDTESVVVLPTATVVAVLQCEDALPSGSGPIQRELLRHYAIGQVFGMVRGQNGKGSEW